MDHLFFLNSEKDFFIWFFEIYVVFFFLLNSDFNLTGIQVPFLSLWESIKAWSMLFIYRLVRFLPASTNIQIIVGTVIDEIRNGGAFFGVLFVRLFR
jgi:hypothetical protein